MNIVVFGATGMIGSRITAEAVSRGHEVTAVSRSGRSPQIGDVAGNGADGGNGGVVRAVAADAGDRGRVAELVKGADAVAAALAPPRDGSDPRAPIVALYTAFLSGVRDGGAPRTVIVGGAGSLEVVPGSRLLDSPDFPAAYRAEALAHADVLAALRADASLPPWTYISPAPVIAPGERTGEFRVAVGDALQAGAGSISAEDYAVAFVDELESGQHLGQRLSVA